MWSNPDHLYNDEIYHLTAGLSQKPDSFYLYRVGYRVLGSGDAYSMSNIISGQYYTIQGLDTNGTLYEIIVEAGSYAGFDDTGKSFGRTVHAGGSVNWACAIHLPLDVNSNDLQHIPEVCNNRYGVRGQTRSIENRNDAEWEAVDHVYGSNAYNSLRFDGKSSYAFLSQDPAEISNKYAARLKIWAKPTDMMGVSDDTLLAKWAFKNNFTTKWDRFDISGASDFYGGAFDGRYVYLVPASGTIIARYDSTQRAATIRGQLPHTTKVKFFRECCTLGHL